MDLQVQYYVHTDLPLDSVLCQMNIAHSLQSYVFMTHFKTILCLLYSLFSLVCPIQIIYVSPVHAICTIIFLGRSTNDERVDSKGYWQWCVTLRTTAGFRLGLSKEPSHLTFG